MVVKIGSGEIDDLSTLSVLSEENLLRELRARYKKGIIYVSVLKFIFHKYFQEFICIDRHILEMFLLR